MKCYIGRYSISNYGLICANSKRQAAKLLGIGWRGFEAHWSEVKGAPSFNPFVMYTKSVNAGGGQFDGWTKHKGEYR